MSQGRHDGDLRSVPAPLEPTRFMLSTMDRRPDGDLAHFLTAAAGRHAAALLD